MSTPDNAIGLTPGQSYAEFTALENGQLRERREGLGGEPVEVIYTPPVFVGDPASPVEIYTKSS